MRLGLGLSLVAEPRIQRKLVAASGSFALTGSAAALNLAPLFVSMTPVIGTSAGGTSVTITCVGASGASVTIGGVACTSVVTVSSTSITCLTGAHATGLVNVVITNSNGTTSGTSGNGAFTYI